MTQVSRELIQTIEFYKDMIKSLRTELFQNIFFIILVTIISIFGLNHKDITINQITILFILVILAYIIDLIRIIRRIKIYKQGLLDIKEKIINSTDKRFNKKQREESINKINTFLKIK